MSTGFDGPDLNSPISEISTALRDLEALPEKERSHLLVKMNIAYLRQALEFREEEEAANKASIRAT